MIPIYFRYYLDFSTPRICTQKQKILLKMFVLDAQIDECYGKQTRNSIELFIRLYAERL